MSQSSWLLVSSRMQGAPNVVWIVTTQWRAHAAGFAGDPNARTPALDQLARESVQFTQAVTPHPFSPFARAALLTGVRSPENGVRHYFDPLPVGARTVAHELMDRGYDTAFFGKWHLGQRDSRAPVVGETHARTIVPASGRGGFDFWEGFESGFLLNDPWLHGSRLPEPQKFVGYQSDVLCERAGAYITERLLSSGSQPRQPLFTLISLEAPHPPYGDASSDIRAPKPASLQLRENVPPGGDVEVKARRELSGYYAHIEATDRAIGRFIASLDLSDTIVVFTSVHGDMHGSHGLFRKGWPYEESIRVPLLVRFPSGVASNRGQNENAISLLDLKRMTLAWAEGRSDLASPRAASISMPSVPPFLLQCDRMWQGVRTPTRKLVLNSDGAPWLYFHLDTDQLEQRNLVADVSSIEEMTSLHALI